MEEDESELMLWAKAAGTEAMPSEPAIIRLRSLFMAKKGRR